MTSAAHKEGEETEAGARVQRERERRGEARIIRDETIMLRAPAPAAAGATVRAVAWSASLVLNWGR